MKDIEITVVLTDAQAWEFAQFLKRVCFSDYRANATTDEEACHLRDAGEQIRSALAEPGYAPRCRSDEAKRRADPARLFCALDPRRVRRRASGRTVADNLRFPGQIFDGQAGLHQNDFRDYDPAIGRYPESDPIGMLGGINTYA